MANKIKLKRGLETNLPTLDVGEPAFTIDTKKPFIGSDTGNIELATKAQIEALASGSPKGVFTTLALLQADVNANTVDGKKSMYVVTADGKWYYWNGTEWTAGGIYQATSANQTSIVDVGNLYNSTNVEGALQEVKSDLDEHKSAYANQMLLKADNTRVDAIEDLVNNVIDGEIQAVLNSEVVSTDIENKLNAKEVEYAPRLTGVENTLERSFERNPTHYTIPSQKPTKAYVTFVDDDGSKDVLAKLLPVFSSRNIPCVVAVNVNNEDVYEFNSMTIEEIKNLQDNYGWEVANHGYNHVNFTTVTGEDLHHEIADCYKHYSAKGIKINSLVYPFGIINDEGRELAKKYHQFGVTAGGGIVPKPLSTFSIPRIPFGSMTDSGSDTYQFYKGKVDEAIAGNKWLIFMTHVWHGSHNSTQQQYLEDILDYCLSNDVEIVTLSQGYKVFGNREEVVGKYVITNNEEKIELTPNTDYKIISDNTIKNDTPISDFKKYTKTITQVHSSHGNTSGFPTSDVTSALGLLETFVVGFGGGSTYSYQMYYEHRHNIVWYRKVSSDGAWNNWEKLNIKVPITVISESVTIPANGYERVRIPFSNLQGLDLIGKSFSVVPISNFDSYVVYSYRYINPNLDIILFNPTTNGKTLNNINWRIKLLE